MFYAQIIFNNGKSIYLYNNITAEELLANETKCCDKKDEWKIKTIYQLDPSTRSLKSINNVIREGKPKLKKVTGLPFIMLQKVFAAKLEMNK